ncbi:unnamed protein product [Effrenium voratum]|nr:unnamed protein product [Effrenium voratum]
MCPECQREDWVSGHKQACAWPVRCPKELLRDRLPRLARLDSAQAQEFLREGRAFVAPAEGLLGRRLLNWDFQYLKEHLPASQRYGVMLDEGSGKIVMSHSARNGQRQVDLSQIETQKQSDEGLFGTSDQTRMTFSDFLEEARRFKESGVERSSFPRSLARR